MADALLFLENRDARETEDVFQAKSGLAVRESETAKSSVLGGNDPSIDEQRRVAIWSGDFLVPHLRFVIVSGHQGDDGERKRSDLLIELVFAVGI